MCTRQGSRPESSGSFLTHMPCFWTRETPTAEQQGLRMSLCLCGPLQEGFWAAALLAGWPRAPGSVLREGLVLPCCLSRLVSSWGHFCPLSFAQAATRPAWLQELDSVVSSREASLLVRKTGGRRNTRPGVLL